MFIASGKNDSVLLHSPILWWWWKKKHTQMNLLYFCIYNMNFCFFRFSRSHSHSLTHYFVLSKLKVYVFIFQSWHMNAIGTMKRQIKNRPTKIGNGQRKKCDMNVIINSIIIYAWISRKRHICSVTYPQFIAIQMDGPNGTHSHSTHTIPAKSFDVKYYFDLFNRTFVFDTAGQQNRETKKKKHFRPNNLLMQFCVGAI